MNVSLDLFIEGEPGEAGSGEWMRIGEELHTEFNRRTENLEALIQGRVMYEIMERAWPAMAVDDSVPDYFRTYGKLWVNIPKYLVSSTRTDAEYNTTTITGPDVISEISRVREEATGDIAVGGPTLATQLLHAGLIDELSLFYHPVVLGSGRPLFDRLDRPLESDLIDHATFEGGVTLQRYAVTSSQP